MHPICRPFLLSAFLISAALGLSACSRDSSNNAPTAPSTINLTGTWSGAFTVQGSAAGMTWTLTEASGSSVVTGPIVVALQDGTVLLNGVLSGTLNGSALTFAITVAAGAIPSQPSCTGQLGGSAVAAVGATSTLAGTLTVLASSCAAPVDNGPFTLTKS